MLIGQTTRAARQTHRSGCRTDAGIPITSNGTRRAATLGQRRQLRQHGAAEVVEERAVAVKPADRDPADRGQDRPFAGMGVEKGPVDQVVGQLQIAKPAVEALADRTADPAVARPAQAEPGQGPLQEHNQLRIVHRR
jgi:hypothetical protein